MNNIIDRQLELFGALIFLTDHSKVWSINYKDPKKHEAQSETFMRYKFNDTVIFSTKNGYFATNFDNIKGGTK